MRRFVTLAVVVYALSTPCLSAESTYADAGRSVAIDPLRGVDGNVDYPGLVRFGPWDDRNYQMTAADVALLAPNEAELRDPIPAFFRALFRRVHPETPSAGPVQYPRSALNVFRQHYGGYLVNGLLYRGVTWTGSRYTVDLRDGVEPSPAVGTDALTGEVRLTSPTGASESAVKISPVDPDRVVAGVNGPLGGQAMYFSTDGGTSWTQSSLPDGGTCCDPAVDWSSDGRYVYTTTLGNCGFSCGVWFYRSANRGETWEPRITIAPNGSDKEYLHVDKHGPSPYTDNLYVTWHDGNVMRFARSTDFGQTWSTQTLSSLSENRGIGSDITTDPNGRVYYLWPAFNSRTIRLARSVDGGVTFGPISVIATTNASYEFPIPAMESRRAFVYVAADADLTVGSPYYGSVYAAWTDSTAPTSLTPANNHSRIQVAFSRDGGDSWTVTTPHETADQLTVDRFHPWLGVGPDGAVYVGYYDTREGGSRTSVDFYYSRSTDGGQTWSTPEDLTSVTSPNILDSFEWGDYNGLDIVMNNLITIFTDNRNEAGGTGDSVDVYAAGRAAGTPAVCGNGLLEAGEACDRTDVGRRTCADFNCSGGTLACDPDCRGFDTTACTGCVGCDNDGTCEPGEDCTNCPSDCVTGTSGGAVCGNGACEAGDGEDCLSCPADCAGAQGGKPTARFCCGDGDGDTPVACSDSRCSSNGLTCASTPTVPTTYCCGDRVCDGAESCANCPLDCAVATTEICGNGIDDDCARGADCSDPVCSPTGWCQTSCSPPDRAVLVSAVRRGSAGQMTLDIRDPNLAIQVTGYNVYRSSTASAPWPWPLVGSNVRDADPAAADVQWTDPSTDTLTGYYQVTAYNSVCGAEGPR